MIGSASLGLLTAPLAARADVTLANTPNSGATGTFGGPPGVMTLDEVFTALVTGTLTSLTPSLDGGVDNLSALGFGGVGGVLRARRRLAAS